MSDEYPRDDDDVFPRLGAGSVHKDQLSDVTYVNQPFYDLSVQAASSAHAIRYLANSQQYAALGVLGAVNVVDDNTVAFREHIAVIAETLAALLEKLAEVK